jgi:type III pantothenate kinase
LCGNVTLWVRMCGDPASMAMLAVDIGNTNVHIGIAAFKGSWLWTRRFSTNRRITADEWHSLLSPHLASVPDFSNFPRIVVCSVVPSSTSSFVDYARSYHESEPLIVSVELDLGVRVVTQHPAQTGTDRIVNAGAAFASFGGPVIIVDLGTATKIDAVDRDGGFLGGAISPGLGLKMDSLAQQAAQLYAVPLCVPLRVISSNTTEAIQSGVVLGHIKMVDGLVEQAITELGGAKAVVATGGHSGLVAPGSRTITAHRPNLTLDGLRIISDRNP